jgi:hypothetical protein
VTADYLLLLPGRVAKLRQLIDDAGVQTPEGSSAD